MKRSNLIRLGCSVCIPILLIQCTTPELAPTPVATVTSKIRGFDKQIKTMTLSQVRSLRSEEAPDSVFVTDSDKSGLYKLNPADKSSPNKRGAVLVTSTGMRYVRTGAGRVSAAWFDVRTDDDDIGPELQNAINSSDEVVIPDGEYTQRTKVYLRSNVTIRANPGRVTIKLTGDGYISFQNWWQEQNLENITIDGLSWLMASTASVDGSYGPITIDGPSVRNLTVQNCRSIHTSPTANVNWFFLKVQPGKVTDNITVRNNYAQNARMGVECLGQHNPEKYLGKNFSVTNNRFENCGFGISMAGSFKNVTVNDNYLKDCPTYGIEFAGWLHSYQVKNNRFEGRFTSLFAGNWENDGDGWVGPGGHVYGNQTVNVCVGKWQVRNGYSMLMEGNNLQMTGLLDLSGATNNARFVNNTFVSTTENKVIQINDVGGLQFVNNYISNEGVSNNWYVIWMNGQAATNNLFIGNTVVKSSGNNIGAGSGANFVFNNNRDQYGNGI